MSLPTRDELLERAIGAEHLIRLLVADAEQLRAAETDVAKLMAASVLMERVLGAGRVVGKLASQMEDEARADEVEYRERRDEAPWGEP